MGRLLINDLNHCQSTFPKHVIMGGQLVSADVDAGVKARVTPRGITLGLGYGIASAIGPNAKTYAGVVIA